MDLIDVIYWLTKFTGRFFAIGPRIWRDGDTVVARSNWFSQLLCLGFAGRRVTIDPKGRALRIRYRSFWLFTFSRRLEFDWVSHVLYGYYGTGGWSYGAYQEDEVFSIKLVLKNAEEVLLFRFAGEGDFVNNTFLPDWMFWWDSTVANLCKGPQEAQSLMYAETVSQLVGVPLGDL